MCNDLKKRGLFSLFLFKKTNKKSKDETGCILAAVQSFALCDILSDNPCHPQQFL